MGDDIGSGLSSMSVCFDFRSTNIVQLSNRNLYFYRFQCHHPLITQLNFRCLRNVWSVLAKQSCVFHCQTTSKSYVRTFHEMDFGLDSFSGGCSYQHCVIRRTGDPSRCEIIRCPHQSLRIFLTNICFSTGKLRKKLFWTNWYFVTYQNCSDLL